MREGCPGRGKERKPGSKDRKGKVKNQSAVGMKDYVGKRKGREGGELRRGLKGSSRKKKNRAGGEGGRGDNSYDRGGKGGETIWTEGEFWA